MAVQRCVDEFDWKSLQEKSTRMSNEEVDAMLWDTPVAEMAAICYSQNEEKMVISPNRRCQTALSFNYSLLQPPFPLKLKMGFGLLKAVRNSELSLLSEKVVTHLSYQRCLSRLRSPSSFCVVQLHLTYHMSGCRFAEDFRIEETQQILLAELEEKCPAADELIGRAFAIGLKA